MSKHFRRILIPVLLLAIVLTFTQTSSAAPSLISPKGEAARYKSTLTGGAVVIITNNYMAADTVEITTADGNPVAANMVYWVYLAGSTDRTAQLGSVTIKKNTSTGKLSVAAAKFGDLSSGYVSIVHGSNMDTCEYGPAGVTDVELDDNATLRNSATGAELLIIDSSIVKKGMTATAIINSKLYKATAKADGVNLQVSLASNMEIGTPVWFTVAAAGCQDVGYSMLKLGEVQTTEEPSADNIRLFFQGDAKTTSSVTLTGLNPGDKVRCYTEDNSVKKSGTVSSTSTMVTIGSLKLYGGDTLYIAVTEKGKLESKPVPVLVPTTAVPAALKSSAVAVVNSKDDGATITVKNVAIGDTITIYDSMGEEIEFLSCTADPDADPDAETAAVVFENLDLGPTSTVIYLSVTSAKGESAWLRISVSTPK